MKKIVICVVSLLGLSTIAIGQSTTATNLQNAGLNRFIGFNNNFPLNVKTNGIQRMSIRPGVGPLSGYIGIGTNFNTPQSPLHVQGSGSFSSAGWTRGITLSNGGALAFSNVGTPSANSTFFMGAPSGTPLGDFYFGTVPVIGGGPVKYAYKTFGQNVIPGSLNQPGSREKSSVQFYTNTYFMPSDGSLAFVGVNILEAKRVLDVKNTTHQLRLTHTENNNASLGIYTDFNVQTFGLDIIPRFNGQRETVFIHKGGTTLNSVMLNVNGNGRYRHIPQDAANCLILGKQIGTDPNDNEFRRLSFTGNNNDVLLGDGTWGTAGSTSGAHNGLSVSTLDPTKIALGNDVGALPPIARLLSDREIPMDNNDIYFTNGLTPPSGTKNRIGIGTTQPLAKLHVKVQDNASAATPIALRLDNNQLASNGIAGGFDMVLNAANNSNFGGNIYIANAVNSVGLGLKITAEQRTTGISISNANGSINNTGLNTRVTSPLVLGALNTVNFGVKSFTNNARINYAGYFESIANPNTNFTTVNYGVRAIADGKAHINYGVYASTDSIGIFNFAGYFDGNVHVIGNITATGSITTVSDQQFKTNINDLTNATDLINQLTPRTFDYDTTNFADFNFESDNQMGLIAQEVELVIPTIVSNHIRPAQYDTLGNEIAPEISYKGVEYEELISLLVAGMQEQQVRIDSVTNHSDSLEQVVTSVNNRLTQLENCLSAILPFLCSLSNSDVQPTNDEIQEKLARIIDVNLTDKNNIVLNQNVPNPFAERTIITFSIPETVQKAQIHFYDGMGKLINSIDVQDRGNGQINVYANDLSTGVYTYSLVADGQIVATKRMMKQ